MNVSSRTPEGWPNTCPICGKSVVISPSTYPLHDAPCPNCGTLLFFQPTDTVETPGCQSTATPWPSGSLSWKGFVWSPMTLCVLAVHVSLVLWSLYSDQEAAWITWVLIACCMLYLPAGLTVMAVGWSARRNYYQLRKYVENEQVPEAYPLLSKNLHRMLLAMGVLLASPAIWLIPWLFGLGR